MRIQRDRYDNWTDNSSVLEEAESVLLTEHGWQRIPVDPYPADAQYHEELRLLVLHGEAQYVFDTIEVASEFLDAAEKDGLRQKINQIFELHDCPWRISDGEFFKLDGDFVGARLAANAHDSLALNGFSGAADEYAKARRYLGSGDVREAIFFAGHSFESVMKVLSGLNHANGDRLIKELGTQGLFDDLPEDVRAGFMDQVLRALPFCETSWGDTAKGRMWSPSRPRMATSRSRSPQPSRTSSSRSILTVPLHQYRNPCHKNPYPLMRRSLSEITAVGKAMRCTPDVVRPTARRS